MKNTSLVDDNLQYRHWLRRETIWYRIESYGSTLVKDQQRRSKNTLPTNFESYLHELKQKHQVNLFEDLCDLLKGGYRANPTKQKQMLEQAAKRCVYRYYEFFKFNIRHLCVHVL